MNQTRQKLRYHEAQLDQILTKLINENVDKHSQLNLKVFQQFHFFWWQFLEDSQMGDFLSFEDRLRNLVVEEIDPSIKKKFVLSWNRH